MNFELTQYLYNSADFSVQLQTMETFPPASASYPRMKEQRWENWGKQWREEGRRGRQSQHNSQLGGGESIWFEIVVWRGRIAAGESFYFCLLLFEDKVKSSG